MSNGINKKEVFRKVELEGIGTAYINLNKDKGNMYMMIPLAMGNQNAQISSYMFFNLEDKDNIRTFGKGIKFNFDGKVTYDETNDKISYESIDGRTYELSPNSKKVYVDDTKSINGSKVYRCENNNFVFEGYRITNQFGETHIHNSNGEVVRLENSGNKAFIDSSDNQIKMRDTVVSVNKTSNIVSSIVIKENVIKDENQTEQFLIYTNQFTYTDSRLSEYKLLNHNNKLLKHITINLDEINNVLEVKDQINNLSYKFYYDANNKITKYGSYYNETDVIDEVTITYYANRTVEKDNKNKTITTMYNSNGIDKQIDAYKNVTLYTYEDGKIKTINHENFESSINENYNVLCPKISVLSNWQKDTNVTITKVDSNVQIKMTGSTSASSTAMCGAKFELEYENGYEQYYTLGYSYLLSRIRNYIGTAKSSIKILFYDDDTIVKEENYQIVLAATKQYALKQIKVEKYFNKVVILIAGSLKHNITITNLQLYAHSNLVEYKYDEDDNVKEVITSQSLKDYNSTKYLDSDEVIAFRNDNIASTRTTLINEKEYTYERMTVNPYLVKQIEHIQKGNVTVNKRDFFGNYIQSENEYDEKRYKVTETLETNSDITYVYDEIYNLLKEQNYFVKENRNYDNEYQLLSELKFTKDNNERVLKYYYDDKRRVKKIQCSNRKYYYFTYTDDLLTKIEVGNSSNKVILEQNEYSNNNPYTADLIKTSKKSTKESFEMTYSDRKIASLIHKKNNTVKNLFNITYDKNDRIQLITDGITGKDKWYEYDENGNVINIDDEDNNIDYQYENGNLVGKTINGNDNRYVNYYDANETSWTKYAKIQKLKYASSGGKNNYFCFFENLSANLENVYKDDTGDIQKDIVDVKYSSPIGKSLDQFSGAYPVVETDLFVPCIHLDFNNRFHPVYLIKSKDNDNMDRGTIMFWFKIDQSSGDGDQTYKTLISINQTTNINCIYLNVNKRDVTIGLSDLYSHSLNTTDTTITKAFQYGKWTFCCLQYGMLKKSDGTYELAKLKCSIDYKTIDIPGNVLSAYVFGVDITHSHLITIGAMTNVGQDVGFASKDEDGDYIMYDESNMLNTTGYYHKFLSRVKMDLTGLAIRSSQYLSDTEIEDYRVKTKEILIDDFVAKNYQNYKIIGTNNFNDVTNYDLYPLHGSLKSAKNDKSLILYSRKEYQRNLKYQFRYDSELSCNALRINDRSSVLAKVSLLSQTIMFRFKLNSMDTSQSIMTIHIGGDLITIFNLYFNNGKLHLSSAQDNIYHWEICDIGVVENIIGLTYERVLVNEDYNNYEYRFKVYLNGVTYGPYASEDDYSLSNYAFLTLGKDSPWRIISPGMDASIDMLVLNPNYSSSETLNSIANTIKNRTSKEDCYNALGLMTSSSIKQNNTSIISHTYEYSRNTSDNNRVLPLITKQNINVGSTTKTINYKYDARSRLISYDDLYCGNKTYTYGIGGELLSESIEQITIFYKYDENGNITQYNFDGDITVYQYGFNTNNKDLLTRADDIFIAYDPYNGLYPIRYYKEVVDDDDECIQEDVALLTWDRGKLTKYQDLVNNKVIEFEYNGLGLRIKKKVTDLSTNSVKETNYEYEEKDLIREYSDNEVIRYFYDHNNEIYAYEVNHNEMYYLIRSIEGSIIGIANSNREIIKKITYEAFGKIYAVSGRNDFPMHIMYKGYYYDEETKLYYCMSRYYSPEFRRFISPDKCDYLEAKKLNGLNLYCYCANNPIMNIDPSGHAPQWLQIAGWIGLGVGILVCGVAIGILTAGVGTATFLGAVAVGAAKGALIGAAIGVGAGAIAGGAGAMIAGEEFGSSEFWSDVLYGGMLGFGVGAVVGTVAGGFYGANGWYNAKALEFTNVGSNEVVLGRSPGYVDVARSRGATYFHTTDDVWNATQSMRGVGSKGMWRINKAFLRQQINAGAHFTLVDSTSGYFYAKEVAYVMKYGLYAFL